MSFLSVILSVNQPCLFLILTLLSQAAKLPYRKSAFVKYINYESEQPSNRLIKIYWHTFYVFDYQTHQYPYFNTRPAGGQNLPPSCFFFLQNNSKTVADIDTKFNVLTLSYINSTSNDQIWSKSVNCF